MWNMAALITLNYPHLETLFTPTPEEDAPTYNYGASLPDIQGRDL